MSGDEKTRKVPDYVETRLAFRVWRSDPRRGILLSVNAGKPARNTTWVAPNMSAPEGEWRVAKPMIARCVKDHPEGVPDPNCSCGVYATTDLSVIDVYLDREAPVLGVVELGGRTIPATQGYRAEAARVAAILLVDELFTLRHGVLRQIASRYQIPALVPHSILPEDFRSEIHDSGVGVVDWDAELRSLSTEGREDT